MALAETKYMGTVRLKYRSVALVRGCTGAPRSFPAVRYEQTIYVVIRVTIMRLDSTNIQARAERKRPAQAACARAAAAVLLMLDDPRAKANGVRQLAHALSAAQLDIDPSAHFEVPLQPGRPARPSLVAPRELARRPSSSAAGRAALLHSIAHIEFNAINLALDAVVRFAGMPCRFYGDWIAVAGEEAKHFLLLSERLASYGMTYGELPAHDGLWEMAARTAHDPIARMALVPRTLEARGLDASPGIRSRLAAAGDMESAAVLDVILREEIGHVAIGNDWYRWLCQREGVDPHQHAAHLAHLHRAPRMRGPFNLEARRAAGFDAREIETLLAAASSHVAGTGDAPAPRQPQPMKPNP